MPDCVIVEFDKVFLGFKAEPWDIAEGLAKVWHSLPKNVVFTTTTRGGMVFDLIAYEADGLWMYHAVRTGSRGGLREGVIVIDPEQEILADQVLMAGLALAPGIFGDIQALRREHRGCRTNHERLQLICQYLYDIHRRFMRESNKRIRSVVLTNVGSISQSIIVTRLPGSYGTGKP